MPTNINIDRDYNTQEISNCNDHTLKNNTDQFHSQSHLSQVSSSSKIKHVNLTSVDPNFTISNVISVNTFITERLRILYILWKIPIVIKDCFNEFNQNDRKVEADNDDISRNDFGKLLFGPLLNKHELSSKEDVHTIFDLLPFDTLKKAYLAWFDEKDEILQA